MTTTPAQPAQPELLVMPFDTAPPLPLPVGMSSWTLRALGEHVHKAIVIPAYQRNFVWDNKHQQLLIDTLLHGWPIPPIESIYDEGAGRFEILDGQQRIRTILRFMNDEFQTRPLIDYKSGTRILGPRVYSALPEVWRGFFDNTTLMVRTIRETPNMPKDEIFARYQNGVLLNRDEKRHANLGVFGLAAHGAANHPFWVTVYSEKFVNRYRHLRVVAAAMLLELAGAQATINEANVASYFSGAHDAEQPWSEVASRVMDRIERNAHLFQGEHANWHVVEMVMGYIGLRAFDGIDLQDAPAGMLAQWVNEIVAAVIADERTRTFLLRRIEKAGGVEQFVAEQEPRLLELLAR